MDRSGLLTLVLVVFAPRALPAQVVALAPDRVARIDRFRSAAPSAWCCATAESCTNMPSAGSTWSPAAR